MTTYSFIDESGETRLVGTISPAPGGGSQAGAVICSEILFTETAGAGTYTGQVVLPAGSTLMAITERIEENWSADTALLNVGDDVVSTTRYVNGAAVDVNNGPFTDQYGTIVAGGAADADKMMWANNVAGVEYDYENGGTIIATITTTGASSPPTGTLRVQVYYIPVKNLTNAVKS